MSISLFRFIRTLALAFLGALPLGVGAESAAATPFVSRSWSTDDGVPHNVVVRVEQDRVGYLWLATMAGLARFDGREFKTYAVPGEVGSHRRNIRDFALAADGSVLFLPASGGVLQLKDDRITAHPISDLNLPDPLLQIYIEPTGAIWLEVGSGLARWQDGRLERYGDADGVNRRRLHFSWATDARGRTWIGGPDLLAYYDAGRLVRVDAPPGVYRIAAARSGGIWAYGTSLYKWEDETLVPMAGAGWPPEHSSTRCLYEDRSGALWLATSRSGLFRFENGRIESVPGLELGIGDVTEDREGDIWLATDGGGLRRLRPKSSVFIDAPVTSVSPDTDGSVWFAMAPNSLVHRTADRQETFALHFGRVAVHPMALCVDGEHRIWITTTLGILRASTSDPTRLSRVDGSVRDARMLFRGRNDDIWTYGPGGFGYYRQDVFKVVGGSLASDDRVTAMAEGPTGPVWIGTSHGELYTFSGDTLTHVHLPPEAHLGTLHALLPETSGAVWIGTVGGLGLLDHGQLRRVTAAEGLPDEVVLQLLQDPKDMWVATPRGLFRIARPELAALVAGDSSRITAVNYGPEEGLTGVSPITNEIPATCVDGQGNLWFCTYKGAVGIVTSRVQHDLTPPPVLVQGVKVDDRVVPVRNGLAFPSGGHRFEFHLAALSFAAPQRVELRHQLEGFETDWNETAPDRVARYSKLPPGDYRLRVVASNGEGVWNERGGELSFRVVPAWWQTVWFRVAVVLAFGGIIGGLARYWAQRQLKARLERLEREHALEKERARIARDMHDELGGSVTGISLAVQRLREFKGAESHGVLDVLDRRVRTLTVELERVVWTVSPTHGTLEQLASFVERFAHNLLADTPIGCRVHGRDSIPAIHVSPEIQHHVLAITKEAINNVVKHSKAHEVVIEMGCENDLFTLVVRDDGVGFEPEAHEFSDRNGLRNMRTRVSEVNGTLALRSAPGAGTEVTLRVRIVAAGPK